MGLLLLTFLMVIMFTFSSLQLLRSVTQNEIYDRSINYTIKARRLERYYKIMAWSLFTGALFFSLLESLMESFTTL